MGSYSQSSLEVEDTPIPVSKHFHPGVCGFCYTVQSNEVSLLRCSQCLLISYCSKACQKKHWSSHRPLCLRNKTLNGKNIFSSAKDLFQESSDWKEWLQYRSDLALTCSINLHQPLTVYEREIFLYPRVCEICKESKSSILHECKKCHSVFYCSDGHENMDKETHSNWCQLYLLCLECDSVEAREGVQDLPFPTIVDEVYKPLPKNLIDLLNPQLTVDRRKTLDKRFVTMIGERLSFPLSLLYTFEKLEKIGNMKSFLNCHTLNIHIIGAESSVELLGIIRWEYLLHRMPSVSKLQVVFIGPNLFKSHDTEEEFALEHHCIEDSGATRCEDCISRQRLVIYEMVTMLYDEFIESNYYSIPNIIVAFNCGFHEYEFQTSDTWMPTLKVITQNEIPLMFTSYTLSEAEKDLKTVLNSNERSIVQIKPHFNPFCSPRPIRDPGRENGNHFFYNNQYLTCITGCKTTL